MYLQFHILFSVVHWKVNLSLPKLLDEREVKLINIPVRVFHFHVYVRNEINAK